MIKNIGISTSSLDIKLCFLNKTGILPKITTLTINKYRSIIHNIPYIKTNTKFIEIIDAISNDCCILIDGATALYHLHPNNEIKEEAYNSMVSIGNFFEELNRNKIVYNKSLDLYFSEFNTSWDYSLLEFDNLLNKTIDELAFYNKRSNIYFDEINQENKNISETIENLCNEYLNPSDLKYDFHITDIEISNLSSQILKTVIQVYINNHYNFDSNTKIFNISADYDLLTTIIKKSDNKSLSERAYKSISNTIGKQNLPKMIEILKQRLIYANSCGYSSFSEYQLNLQTLKINPKNLIRMLKQMWIDLRPNLISELKILYKYKLDKMGINSDTATGTHLNTHLTPLEVDALRSSYIDDHLKTIDEKQITRRYITIGNLLNGLMILTKTLFQKDLYMVLDENELSAELSEENEHFLHESVLVTYLKHNGEIKAKIYFDFFNRDGKYKDVFSQFTIRGSKTLNMYNYKIKQIPCVILATNLEVTDLDLLNMQISFSDAKNIFHEYGHVLHSVLSTTDFQSLSGNRIPLDFAEIPSHLLEYFLYDYSFCQMWMIDKKSNEVIDKNLHSLCVLQSKFFSNLDLQETLYNSIFDLEIHSLNGENINEAKVIQIHQDLIKNFYISSIFSFHQYNFDSFDKILFKYQDTINSKYAIDKFYNNLLQQDKINIVSDSDAKFREEINQLITNSLNDQSFKNAKSLNEAIYNEDSIFTILSHFKNYPSNYYTYVIGKVFSNLLWTDCINNNTLKKNYGLGKIGEILEEEFLSRGNTKNSHQLIQNVFKKVNKLI